jgi:hypothetical protein
VQDPNAAAQCFPQTQTDEWKANPKSIRLQNPSVNVSNNNATAKSSHDNFNVLEETDNYGQEQNKFANASKFVNTSFKE